MLQPIIKDKDNTEKEDNPKVGYEVFEDDPTEPGTVNGDTRASSQKESDASIDAQPASPANQILAPEVTNNTLSEIKNFSSTTKPDLAGKIEITNETFTSKTTAWNRD